MDKELRERFSDLLYRVKLRNGRGAYVYVLFEHKSGSEPLIALHLLRYMVKIWEQWLQQGGVLVLKRLLTRRFGALPPWVEEKLTQADRETLERWAERVLEAVTLEELFEAP